MPKKTTNTFAHPHLRLLPPPSPHLVRYPGMTDQEVFSAKCEARAAWLESLGFDPDTCTTDDLIRLVHSGASKPRDDGWAQLFGPGWQPPDPNFRYALPQEGLRLPSPRMNGVTATGKEGAGLIWQPPDPDARYDINTDE